MRSWWKVIGGAVIVGVLLVAADLYWFHWTPIFRGSGETSEAVAPKQARELARRFAPVIRLAAGEAFVPLSRGAYLSVADLKAVSSGGVATFTHHPSLAQLPVTPPCARRCRLFLDLEEKPEPGDRTLLASYARLETRARASAAGPLVYYNVLRYTPSGDYTVQYWFLYLFNRFRFDNHESDWEEVIVHLDAETVPQEVFFSTHSRGQTESWKSVATTSGEHPLVFSGLGSHANFKDIGLHGFHQVLIACKAVLRQRVCLTSRTRLIRDRSDGCGPTLVPRGVAGPPRPAPEKRLCVRFARTGVGPTVEYGLQPLFWPVFAGNYGPHKTKFFRDPQRRPLEWSKSLDWLESVRG